MNFFKLNKLLVVFTLFFLIPMTAFADKGVFNAKVTPHETLTNTPTTIRVTAEIGAENLYISSVTAFQTTADGKPVRQLGLMYDDGTHGDQTESDTVFTMQFSVSEPEKTTIYVRITAAYKNDRNRYLSPIMKIDVYQPLQAGASEAVAAKLNALEQNFNNYMSTMDIASATQRVLQDARNDPDISSAELSGNTISILFRNGIRGMVILNNPNSPMKAPGSAIPVLPDEARFPGNDKLMIFAPYYGTGLFPWELHFDANDASNYFDDSVYMEFSPNPPTITRNSAADLDTVMTWGDYGTVIVDSHGGFWGNEVVVSTGTEASQANQDKYQLDLLSGRVGQTSDNRYAFYPSFIREHANAMKNTFFWFGSCSSLHNDSLWNEIRAKGGKVAFGWSDSVANGFANGRLEEVLEDMLPDDSDINPSTAKEAFDAVPDKVDDGPCIFGWCLGDSAALTFKTASSEWDNFVFAEGGIVNGDFETGDWTGWEHGGNYDYRIISGARKHGGNDSAALGRWDTSYHGYDPTSEPYGYEWFYQDFVVPNNVTTLKFCWWMETYDTAAWDWFDAYIRDTNGNTLMTILSHAGKPGFDYGPYWTTGGWREASVNISAYRGQKIRIYFDQRLDGYGDQQRVYIDDVTLE